MANRVIVVGAGAAGLMAAGTAALQGAEVLVIEKNAIPAKKIRISGKGRCNITNARPIAEFIPNYPGNGKFLYSALNRFTNQDLINLLAEYGLETKVERGQRVFPVSDDANQVADTLTSFARTAGAEFKFNTEVQRITVSNQKVQGVVTSAGFYAADRVIIATGGSSYPRTGSTGDGYTFAKELGHTVVPLFPALVALRTQETWVQQVSGLSLKNVTAAICCDSERHSEIGEMQFAHFGVTGPIILTLSRQAAVWLREGRKVTLSIDLKPALSESELDKRLQSDFRKYQRKQFKNSLNDLLPKSLIPVIIELSQIPPDKQVHQITRTERFALIRLLKQLTLTIANTLPLSSAIVTAGGVSTAEINPKTMESKLIKGLYFAGEVIDIDGVTGGFNLQAAFSTGNAAGFHAGQG